MATVKAVRSFLVVLGGPLVLVALAVSGAVSTLRSVARARRPSPLALTIVGLTAVYLGTVRPWHRRWGSDPRELREPLPGDEVLERRGTLVQHAVSIEAPAGESGEDSPP